MATIWRSPPESAPARCFSRFFISGNSPSTSSIRSPYRRGRWKAPICRFSSIVSVGKTLFVCGTKPTPFVTSLSAPSPVISSPRRRTVPLRMLT